MPKLRHRTAHTDTARARCRMCGTTVELGADGCCPLGHPAGTPAEAGPVEAGPAEAGPAEAGPVEAEPVEAEPVEAGPVEAEPVVEAAPVEGSPVDAVAPPTVPDESTTRADEDADTAARLAWLDWDAAAGPAAPPCEPAALPPPVAKLPPPPATPAPPPLPAADRVPGPDQARAALDALLTAHHQQVPPSALNMPMQQRQASRTSAPLASSPATDAHGHDDVHAEARALTELWFGGEGDAEADADAASEERPRGSRRLAVRIAGAVLLALLTAAMTAAAVVAF